MKQSLFLSKCPVVAYRDKENYDPHVVGYIIKSDVFLLLEIFFYNAITGCATILHPRFGICYVYVYTFTADNVPNWAEPIETK